MTYTETCAFLHICADHREGHPLSNLVDSAADGKGCYGHVVTTLKPGDR